MTRLTVRLALLTAASALIVSLAAYVPMIVSGHITRDSGVFLYTGMAVSRGGMPYVDSWDHKGPLLAVIETLAWRLGGGIVGAPILEALVLFSGLTVAGLMWSRWIRAWAPVLVLFVGVTYLGVFEGGNFTETWLFPFQLVAYSFIADTALRSGREAPTRIVVGAGLTIGLAVSVGLFTRMNNVAGLLVLAGICVVFFRRRLVFSASVVGVIAVVGIALTLWLWTGDALRAAVDQYVRYNLFYSEGTALGERVASFAMLAQLLVAGAIVGVALVMFSAAFMTRTVATGTWSPAMSVLVVFFAVGAIDALSQMASGRPYPHYLVVAVAGFTVAAAAAGAEVQPAVGEWWRRERRARRRTIRVVGIAALAAFVLSSSGATALQGLRTTLGAGVFIAGSYQAQIVDRVLAETSPDDRVLVHGAETWILAASQRLSPTAITYSLPVEQGYGGLPAQYLADVMAFPPALIVESPLSCGISIACPVEKAYFAGLAPWVVSSYELDGEAVGFRFWRSLNHTTSRPLG
ncbi:hypothetical protein SAMN04487848_0951 [Microbacterium sp. ru370.1]|uniref:hypothetical protein n=1 Tax=unclassified Microbacterium TaxID=2609290 RepID=UPI00088EF930|nr:MULTISPECIES: hypothetical protein [unclassified Microbacterium]SDO45015.1 hypothetical protein SAMN04487848_0951 [Microbacterium sp. ru370.1]SIT81188.1 hypothetical protein SAMN05880579_0947 [Microbacterium sp. RU1D]